MVYTLLVIMVGSMVQRLTGTNIVLTGANLGSSYRQQSVTGW